MAHTNDKIFEALKFQYPAYSTLGDLMWAFAQDNGYDFRDTRAYAFYVSAGGQCDVADKFHNGLRVCDVHFH